MVGAVAQEQARARRDAGRVLAQQRAQHLALRPERTPDLQELAPQPLDLHDPRRLGPRDYLLLQRLELLAVAFQEREVAVDQGVDQRIGQVVDATAAHRALGAPQAFPHGVEAVAWALLEGEHEVPAKQDRELLGNQSLGPIRQPQYDEQVIVVALQLRALVGVHDVRDGERMQPVAFAEPADQLDVREPLHVDPDPGQPGRALLDVRKLRAMMLDQPAVIVGEQAHARRTGIRGRRQRAWRRARRWPPRPPAPIEAALPSRGGLRTRRRLRCADLVIYCCGSCCSDWGVRRATPGAAWMVGSSWRSTSRAA